MRVRTLISWLAALLLCGSVTASAFQAPTGPSAAANQAETGVLVFKKWIGASGDEPAVEAHLVCESGPSHPAVRVNRDRPDGWTLDRVPEEGMLCSVFEVERETFVADMEDCRDLLVLPGQDVECTLVNTKVVKRIDMLNRYGLVMMIAVMLGAGLAAVRRHTAG